MRALEVIGVDYPSTAPFGQLKALMHEVVGANKNGGQQTDANMAEYANLELVAASTMSSTSEVIVSSANIISIASSVASVNIATAASSAPSVISTTTASTMPSANLNSPISTMPLVASASAPIMSTASVAGTLAAVNPYDTTRINEEIEYLRRQEELFRLRSFVS